MRKTAWIGLCAVIIITLAGCDRTKEAIELVKKAKLSGSEQTIEEQVQKYIDEGAQKNIQYKWVAEEKAELKTWLVSFVDTVDERGYFWEADLNSKIVKSISDNWLLKKKYGITPRRWDGSFTVENVKDETVKISRGYLNQGIVYSISGEIKNNTDKTITTANAFPYVIVIYSEQKVIEKTDATYLSEFDSPSSESPWKPGESRKFKLVAEAIDTVYKDYKPIDAFCYIFVKAEDPLGYEYSGAIDERDLTEQFGSLQ